MGILGSIGAGLSSAGDAVSKFAGEAALAQQKNQLEQSSIQLTNQLAAEREHAGRVETGATAEAGAKQVGAAATYVTTNNWLKMAGYENGLGDFGVTPEQYGKTISGQRNQAPAGATTSPAGAAPAAQQSTSAVTGPDPALNNALTATQVPSGQGAKPPVILGPNGKPIGLALPPGYNQQAAGIVGPEGIAKAWSEWAKPQLTREGQSITYFDFNSGKTKVLYYQPKLPVGSFLDENGEVATLTGANKAIEASAKAESTGTSQGALPAQEALSSYEAGVRAATDVMQQYDPVKQQMVYKTRAQTLRELNNDMGLPSPPGLGVKPSPDAPAPTGSGVGAQSDGSFILPDRTTVIPPAPSIPAPKGGIAAAPSAVEAGEQATYNDLIKDWHQALPLAAQAEERFQEMGEALKTFQSGAWAEVKGEVARHLIAAGVDKKVVEGLANDPSQMQTIMKNNFGAALDQLASTRMGRITQNEIFALRENLANPNLEPEANRRIIAQGIGLARWQIAMAGGWEVARRMGYDPGLYQTSFIAANPVKKYRDAAMQEIGAMKGESVLTRPIAPENQAKYGGAKNAVSNDGGKTWQPQQ